MTLWGGVFSQPTDDTVRRPLNDSLRFDRRLYDVDITCSIAYARALAGAGVLTAAEARCSPPGWNRCAPNSSAGAFSPAPGDEDIHTAVERRLSEIDRPGGRQAAHRAQPQRSGGDRFAAVAVERCRGCADRIARAAAALVDQAEHIRDAHARLHPPPARAAHHGRPLADEHFWTLARDVERLERARTLARVNARSDRARWPGRPTRLTGRRWRQSWAFAAPAPTAWTPSRTAISSPNSCSPPR